MALDKENAASVTKSDYREKLQPVSGRVAPRLGND